jgi:hypothetical protein
MRAASGRASAAIMAWARAGACAAATCRERSPAAAVPGPTALPGAAGAGSAALRPSLADARVPVRAPPV